jgi:hypothetical protein
MNAPAMLAREEAFMSRLAELGIAKRLGLIVRGLGGAFRI